jgi:hypothetical protein
MFFWKGDCDGWHNIACAPQVARPLGPWLLTGMFVAAAGVWLAKRRAAHAFLLLWLVLMLLPAVIGWEGMHAIRTIGAIPAVFLLTAVGADTVFQRIRQHRVWLPLFLVFTLGGALFEYYRYFGIWANHPDTLRWSKHHLTTIAEFLNAQPASTPRFVIVNEYGEFDPIDPAQPDKKTYTPAQTVIFLTREHPHPKLLLMHESLTQPFPKGSLIVPLLEDARLFPALRERGIELVEERHGEFVAARVK